MLELARYIVLNPVRAKMVKTPERYPWSSYRAMVGLAPVPRALATEWMLDQFAGTRVLEGVTSCNMILSWCTIGHGSSAPH